MAVEGDKTAKHFAPPPDCPVFIPTIEEFADPLSYIAKIRPRAEPHGICKIRTPAGWDPPFCVNFEALKFTPRIQRINELEAHTRIKINFLDRLAKFWELQGSLLQVPTVERKTLDLYKFFEMVRSKGGYGAVEASKSWDQFAKTLVGGNVTGEEVKAHYKRILYPFELFEDGKCLNHLKLKNPNRGRKKRTQTNLNLLFDPLAKYVCQKCSRGDGEDQMLLCDGCDESWHTFCLVPPLEEIPPGDWRCPKCVLVEVRKPTEGFGFEQASREYSLPSFGRMADDFKTNYFGRPLHQISVDDVEQEFWKIVSNVDADVSVEYGADLHSVEHGSGFPTKGNQRGSDWRHSFYRDSPWNLNNLPVLEGSLLSYINSDISGMMVPWMYVGMCFSTFCWHNEDHWSYSINYLHWGEPKTWYGVPGDKAYQFESVMKCHAPELFEHQPDLLHQLVTIMNPNILMKAGVPIYRCMQYPGDFVITFPRAYHAGFNQGYNFAEAVNFCPPDWLPKGRQCMTHYSAVKRFCVFSQDELVCKMAGEMRDAPVTVAVALIEDLSRMRKLEVRERQRILSLGCRLSKRDIFELLSDDVRQCACCKTTIYLSALCCPCNNKYACLRHHQDVCECPIERKVFCYRYTLDELTKMIEDLRLKTVPFKEWLADVAQCMRKTDLEVGKPKYEEIESLVLRGTQLKFKQSELFSQLKSVADRCCRYSRVARRVLHLDVDDEEACKKLVQNLLREDRVPRCAKPHGNSREGKGDDAMEEDECPHKRVTLADVKTFVKVVEKLPGVIPEYDLLKKVLAAAEEMSAKTVEFSKNASSAGVDIPAFIAETRYQVVYIDDVDELDTKYQYGLWAERANALLNNPTVTTHEAIEGVVKEYQPDYEELGGRRDYDRLFLLRKSMVRMETAAEALMEAVPKIPFNELESFVKASKLLAPVKHSQELLGFYASCMDCMRRLTSMIAAPTLPLMQDIEALCAGVRRVGVYIPHLESLESRFVYPKKWIQRVERAFSPRNGRTLLDVFLPFADVQLEFQNFTKPRDNSIEAVLSRHGVSKEDFSSTEKLRQACNVIADKEILQMRKLRLANASNAEVQCVCSKPTIQRPNLVRCELCKALYHAVCCSAPTYVPAAPCGRKDTGRNTSYRVLCPRCDRGNRVQVGEIIDFVNSLEKSRVRTLEGEAFQFFAHRIVEWKKKAQEALEKPEQTFNLVKPPADEDEMEVDSSEDVGGSRSPAGSGGETDDPRKKHPRKPTHTVIHDLNGARSREKLIVCYEWILMEGLLFNATLAEVDDIWALLQLLRKEHAMHVVPNPADVDREMSEMGTVDDPRPRAPASPVAQPFAMPGPSRSPVITTNAAASCSPRRPVVEEPRSSPKKGDSSDSSSSDDSESESGSEASKSDSSEESSSDSEDSDDARKKVEEVPKKRGRPRKTQVYDEPCEARRCMMREAPVDGKHLKWIQCDYCERWLHFVCVGLKDDFKDVEGVKYACPICALEPTSVRNNLVKVPAPRGRPPGSKNKKKREPHHKPKTSASNEVPHKARTGGVKPKFKATLKPKVK